MKTAPVCVRVVVSVLLVLTVLPLPLYADIDAGPHIENITYNSAQLLYEGDASDGNGLVEYGLTPEYGLSAVASKRPLMDEWYSATLTDLEPASRYFYKLTHEGEVKEGSFFTPVSPGNVFTFAVLGDTQSGGSLHQAIVNALLTNGYPDLLCHTGDMVSDGTKKDLWQAFFANEEELLLNTVMAPAHGNHDHGLFGNYFAPGQSGKFWFGFPYGNAYFIVLNTEQNTAGAQRAFLEEQLITARSTPDIDFIFVFFHKPGVTTSTSHNPDLGVLLYFLDLFEAYNVDMVFNGHNHVYEHGIVNGVHYIVTGAAASSLYGLIDPYEPEGWTIVHRARIHHYDLVTVSDDSYTFQAKTTDGTLLDSFTATVGEGGFPGDTPPDLLERALGCGGCASRYIEGVGEVNASTANGVGTVDVGFAMHLLVNLCLYGLPAIFIIGIRTHVRGQRRRP